MSFSFRFFLFLFTSSFNTIFEVYEGRNKGSQIKSLVSTVNSKNKDADRKITVKFNDSEYTDSFSEISDLVETSKTYEVKLDYDSEGFVNKVIIDEQ